LFVARAAARRKPDSRLLDDIDLAHTQVGYFDGRHDNWMAGMRPTPWPIDAAKA
jgi:hypothetical protein